MWIGADTLETIDAWADEAMSRERRFGRNVNLFGAACGATIIFLCT